MKKLIVYSVILLFISVFFSCSNSKIKYPKTKKVDTVDVYFGTKIHDPYRWLENDTSLETKEWIELQNKITFDYLNRIPYRKKIKDRLTQIWNYEKISAPFQKKDKLFFFKNDGLQNQDILYVIDKPGLQPRVLIDPNKFSEDGSASLINYAISADCKYIAYGISNAGSDAYDVFIKEISTGNNLNDKISGVKFSEIAWYKNGFYYSRYDNLVKNTNLTNINYQHKIYYHQIGTSQDKDELIFENKEYPNRTYEAYLTPDEKYMIISESETTSGNSIYVRCQTAKNKNFIKLTTGFEYEYYVLDHFNDKLIVLTNYKAPKYKLIAINVNTYNTGNWIDIIPEKSEVLSFCQIVGDKIIAGYLKDAYSKIEIYNQQGRYINDIQLPSYGTVSVFNGEKENQFGYFSFSSFTYPPTIYKYDSKTNNIELYYQPKIDVDISQFETKQVFYRSKDGVKIPMFITYKKGTKLNGKNPLLLYGYGGFNISITPSFSISRLLWLENGGIYASANIRGGGEYGENWHLAGSGFNKQNVFDDFISAAEYLINEGYTSPEKLAITGRSNGGLLIGAVINQRPELFKVAVPQVGVMDMLRFHKFTIGWMWKGDYLSSEDSAGFINLIKYSPLHNINSRLSYPAVLVMTADHDDRVVPAHSFKYIATLQEKYKGHNPVLIRIQTKSGHGAGKSTTMQIDEAADFYSFIFYNLDFKPFINKK
jgi:prolyl oligopeptidase